MNLKPLLISLCLCLALSVTMGCAPSMVTKPKVVKTTKWRTVKVDEELIQDRDCPAWEDVKNNEDLVNAYQACWTANEASNVDKGKIRGLK